MTHEEVETSRESIRTSFSSLKQHGIILHEPDLLFDYISQNPKFINVVNRFVLAAKQNLPMDTQFILGLYQDPEPKITDVYLTLCARTTNYDRNFLEHLSFAQNEAAAQLTEDTGWIILNSDFLPPVLFSNPAENQ